MADERYRIQVRITNPDHTEDKNGVMSFFKRRHHASKTVRIMNGDINLEVRRQCQRASQIISPFIIFC